MPEQPDVGDAKSFDSMGDLIDDLKKPDRTDNAGPESATEEHQTHGCPRCHEPCQCRAAELLCLVDCSHHCSIKQLPPATESPKLITVTPERLQRLEWIATAARQFRRAYDSGGATSRAYALFCECLDEKGNDMTFQEIEDAARVAADALTERSEQLDQREADLSGKIEDMKGEIQEANEFVAQLKNCLETANRQRDQVAHDLRCKLNVEIGSNLALNKQLDAAARAAADTADLVTKVAAEREEALQQRDRAIAAEKTVGYLKNQISGRVKTINKLNCQLDALQRGNTELSRRLADETGWSHKIADLQRENRELKNARLNEEVGPLSQRNLSCKIDELDRENVALERENKKLAEKLERWNKIEIEGVAHIKAALDDIGRFLDVIKASPK